MAGSVSLARRAEHLRQLGHVLAILVFPDAPEQFGDGPYRHQPATGIGMAGGLVDVEDQALVDPRARQGPRAGVGTAGSSQRLLDFVDITPEEVAVGALADIEHAVSAGAGVDH